MIMQLTVSSKRVVIAPIFFFQGFGCWTTGTILQVRNYKFNKCAFYEWRSHKKKRVLAKILREPRLISKYVVSYNQLLSPIINCKGWLWAIRSKHHWKLARLSSFVNWRILASFPKGNVVSTFISISTLVHNASGPIWLYLDSCL